MTTIDLAMAHRHNRVAKFQGPELDFKAGKNKNLQIIQNMNYGGKHLHSLLSRYVLKQFNQQTDR